MRFEKDELLLQKDIKPLELYFIVNGEALNKHFCSCEVIIRSLVCLESSLSILRAVVAIIFHF